MKVNGGWKSWFKAQHSENWDHGIQSHHFMANRWGNGGNGGWLYFWGAPKSLKMVTAAKTLAPWKKSYDQHRQRIKKQRHYFADKGPSSQSYGFSSGHVWMWELDRKESWVLKNWCFWTVELEKTLESPLDCNRSNQWILKEISPDIHWKDWCWSSNTLATSCEELTHWKRLWCWESLGAGGEGDDRGWDGWMASPARWTWVWVNSGSWWWTGSPGVLWFMGSQRVGHDWATELNSLSRKKAGA